jgi:hypothetical protein
MVDDCSPSACHRRAIDADIGLRSQSASVEYVHLGYHPQRTVLRGLFDHVTLNLSHS